MTAEVFEFGVRDALSRAPDSAWIHRDVALFGWGVSARIDVGTGADRFDRALRRLTSFEAPLAMASFTFDENDPGSVVVIPRNLVKVDADGTSFLIGDPDDLPPPAPPLRRPPVTSATVGSKAGRALSVTRSERSGNARRRRSSSPDGFTRTSTGRCQPPWSCPISPETSPALTHSWSTDS